MVTSMSLVDDRMITIAQHAFKLMQFGTGSEDAHG
jgi:hypothetical protein